mgnify:FL=1
MSMNYAELQHEAEVFRGALLVESLVSGPRLFRIERLARVVVGALFLLIAALFSLSRVFPFLAAWFPAGAALFSSLVLPLVSLLYLAAGAWLFFLLVSAFYASSYFKDVHPTLLERPALRRPTLRYEAAAAAGAGSGDPLLDFFASRFGLFVALRLGLSSDDLARLLSGRQGSASRASFELRVDSSGSPAGLREFAEALLRSEPTLRAALAGHALEEADLSGAAEWVSHSEERYKSVRRSFGRDALGRIPGIGKDWAYGETPLLAKYTTAIEAHPGSAFASSGSLGKREADELERILSRGREANALVIGEEGAPMLAPFARLARRISSGTVLPPLEHKRVVVFDGALFVSAQKEKQSFEAELLRLLGEAARAGNIIFVFDRFGKFLEGARALNSDALTLMDPFLAGAAIQIGATAETGVFRAALENHAAVKERFERVFMEATGAVSALPVLEDEALFLEARERVFFTFPALRAVAEAAERYFFEGVMPDKAVDLLRETVPKAHSEHKRLITREDVLELVSRKTGIQVGAVKGEERSKLLKLEELLHERIVGQDEAVAAISGALRRARSGIGNPHRPMGTFLFLGPTGVGKTETTKALAQAFFGDEKAITRLDMSEYQTPDALNRLIGTFESGKPGLLASLLRERPYGVLLLDEFEKTNTNVHDLFLQILDEGFFTDAAGKRVNARNLMIIATSNAGSDLIWNQIRGTDAEQEPRYRSEARYGAQRGTGAEIKLDKDRVITEIINRGIFKPEFLNRFDGVILFHPLDARHLRAIAGLLLEKLSKRLKEKGLELLVSDALLDYLVSVGQDPKFGARPMNRAIQQKVEQVIAEKMLRGEIAAGSRVELSPSDVGAT